MAAIPTSPAVVFIEKDNSAYPPNIDSSIVGIVGYATKGPENVATLITSQENLLQTFGNPLESLQGQGLEGALEILETTNQIRYVRAIPSDAAYASATVTIGACPAVLINASSIGLSTGVLSAVSLVVSLKDSDGVQVLDPTTYVIYSGTSFDSYGQASALANTLGNATISSDKLSVHWDPTSTDATIGKNSGMLVGAWAGTNARLSVSAFSGVYGTAPYGGISALAAFDASGNTITPYASSVTASGFTFHTSSLAYRATALYRGSGYNLGTNLITGQTSGISIESEDKVGPNSNLNVNVDGVNSETFNVSLLNGANFIENIINIGTTNNTSDYIKGEIARSNSTDGTPAPLTNFYDKVTNLLSIGTVINSAGTILTTSATPRFNKLIDIASVALSGGADGTGSDSALIGTDSPKTGIKALDDDNLNISIALVPGINSQDVQNALITLAEQTSNFVAVVSPPMGLSTVQKASDWMNGKGNGRTAAINSSWAAVFWPWVQVFDVFSAKDMWLDPAIYAVRQMVYTDNVAEPWFAPAGFRRGRLTKPTATELPLNQGDRDNLYVTNLNPIVNFVPDGITIFGQKTAQRASTSLDRINVRRLMIYLRKVLLQTGRIDLFEPNDAFTWEIVKDKAESVLSDIQARRGITDFKVICDETVNTPLRVDRNELWCKILIKPTKTAEWIVFEVNLTNQSAKFSG